MGLSSVASGTGCGPDVSATSASGSGTDSSGPTETSEPSATGPGDTTSVTTGREPSCAEEADLVVGSACYRELELDEVRTWYPGESAAVRLTGSELAEVVIRTKESEVVVVSIDSDKPQIVAEFEEIPEGSGVDWPPIPLDVNGDGLEDALFGTGGVVVHVLSYDPSTGEYTVEAHDDLLPADTFYVHIALDVDHDGTLELIASTDDPSKTTYMPHLIVVDEVDGAWESVGDGLLVPEISSDLLVTKPFPADEGSTAKLGYIHSAEGSLEAGVTILRVEPGFVLATEARFDADFTVRDFAAGDFDGNGFTDVYIAGGGYDHDLGRNVWRNDVYFFDGAVWSGPSSYDLGESAVARAGDMTGNGIADLLTVTVPAAVLDLSSDNSFELVDAAWPLGLHDVDSDGLGDLVFRPHVDPPDPSFPTSLRLLLSMD